MNLIRGIVALALLAGTAGCRGKPSPPPIVIGHVACLSGADKSAGIRASFGIRLALDELNKDKEPRIEVRHTDTRGNVDSFESQAVRLLALNKAAAFLGGDNPDEVLRLDRAVQPESPDHPVLVPIVSPCGWRTRSMSKQVYLTGMTPRAQARVLARHAVEALSVDRMSLLVDQGDERARIVGEVFVREFAEAWRNKQPSKEPARPSVLLFGGGVSLTDLLAQLGDGIIGRQVVLLAGSKTHLRQVNEKLQQTSEKTKQPSALLYAGADGSLRTDDWPIVTQKGAGIIYFASAFGVEKGHEPAEKFVEQFRQRFGDEPDVHAALAYEGMKLLADALRRGTEPAKPRDELFKNVDIPGLAGPLHFDSDQVLVRPLFVMRLDRDQLVVVKKYAP
jgi:branched-chain amino acid transport system substrate-binding protein